MTMEFGDYTSLAGYILLIVAGILLLCLLCSLIAAKKREREKVTMFIIVKAKYCMEQGAYRITKLRSRKF